MSTNVALRVAVCWLVPSHYSHQPQASNKSAGKKSDLQDGQLNFTLYFSMHFNVDVQVHVQPDCRRTTAVRVMLRCHRLVWPSGNLASLSISSSWSLGKLSVAAETPGSRKARVLLS